MLGHPLDLCHARGIQQKPELHLFFANDTEELSTPLDVSQVPLVLLRTFVDAEDLFEN